MNSNKPIRTTFTSLHESVIYAPIRGTQVHYVRKLLRAAYISLVGCGLLVIALCESHHFIKHGGRFRVHFLWGVFGDYGIYTYVVNQRMHTDKIYFIIY